MIGNNELCLYKNMKEYCQVSKAEFGKFREEFEPIMNKKIKDACLQVKNPLNIKMTDCKKDVDHLRKQVERMKKETQDAFDHEKKTLDNKLNDVLPALEKELKTMQKQHTQFAELPLRVEAATENLEEVQKKLEFEMRSLDVNTKNVVTELRENLEDQLNKAQEALNTKIDDVERKTMSFAQRAASGQGDQK